MNCPCEDCLKLAICIGKDEIKCQDMVEYMNDISQKRITFWEEVNKFLPKLYYVHGDPREPGNGYRGFHR